MVMAYSLLMALVVPLVFVPIAYFVGKTTGKNTGWIIAASLVVSLLLFIGVALRDQRWGRL